MDSAEKVVPLPFESPAQPLEVEATAAALQLVPVGEGDSPRIEQAGAGRALPVEVTRVEGVVRVRIGMPEAGWLAFLGRGGPFAFKLFVPKNVKAKIRCSAGMLHAERFEDCELDLATSTGAIHLSDVKGRMALRADAGQIRGQRLSGRFQVEANAGAVRLHIVGLDSGEHRIHSSMGSVQVHLAPGIKVQIETRTSMGSTRNRYPSTPGAEATLHLEAELGSVKVDESGTENEVRGGGWDDWRKHWAGDVQKWASGWEKWSWLMRPEAQGSWHRRSGSVGSEELKRILNMVEQGKINAEEAERLIRAIEGR